MGLRKGDRVIVFPLMACGRCLSCRTGNNHVCSSLKLIGIDMDGGMAQYASVPAEALVKIPECLDNDIAALVEPLAVAIHSIRESNLKFLDRVLITGAGPIGLMTGISLKDAGASGIYITELDEYRLSVCRELGLNAIDAGKTDAVDFIKSETNGEGADIVFEASGVSAASLQMTELVRTKGTIVMLSVHKHPDAVDLRQVNFKEIALVGSRVYTRTDFDRAVQYAVKVKDTLKRIISHRIPLGKGGDAFRLANDRNVNTLKILIDCEDI